MIRGRTTTVDETPAAPSSELDELLDTIRAAAGQPGMRAATTAAGRMLAAMPALDESEARAIGIALVLVAWSNQHATTVAEAGAAFTPDGRVDPRMLNEAAGNILGLTGARLVDAARLGGL